MFPFKRNSVDPNPLFTNLVSRDDGVMTRKINNKDRIRTNGFPPVYDFSVRGKPDIRPSIIFDKTDDTWENFTLLSEYFSERVRFQSRVKGNISMLEWFEENKDRLIENYLKLKRSPSGDDDELVEAFKGLSLKESFRELANDYEFSEYVWDQSYKSGLKIPTGFSNVIAKALYKFFDSKIVLDPSAGWGDRLLGAIASVDEYHGVDPNTKMAPVYKEIIDFSFSNERELPVNKNKNKFKVFTEDFLEFRVRRGYYDTVMTSPPYFDYEIYTDEETQSVSRFPDLDDWVENFIFPYLDKCVKALKKDGNLVLHLSDTSKGRYMSRIMEHLSASLYYRGLLFVGGSTLVPVWVFQKSHRRNNPRLFPRKDVRSPRKFTRNPNVRSSQDVRSMQMESPRKFHPQDVRSPRIKVGSQDIRSSQDVRSSQSRSPRNQKDPERESQRLSQDLEPPIAQIHFRDVRHRNKRIPEFTVLDDSKLKGGTKQRLFNRLLRDLKEKNVVYAGPETGYAQIALALTAKVHNKQAHIFISNYSGKFTDLTRLAESLGARIHPYRAPLRKLREYSEKFAMNTPDTYVVPFGGESKETKEMYIDALKFAVREVKQPKRLWLAAGSGFTLKCLQEIWPETKFMVVQVGKAVDWYVRKEDKLFISQYKFPQKTRNPPPYNSLIMYDAKVWDFFVDFGENGDYIWNVAGNLF